MSNLEHLFTYHAPHGDQVGRYGELRAAGLTFALTVERLAPDTAEARKAIECVREAVMWANAAIACNEHPAVWPEPNEPAAPTADALPHSRACTFREHQHGPACHSSCPTCGGRTPPVSMPTPR